jgi:hypothetical protein
MKRSFAALVAVVSLMLFAAPAPAVAEKAADVTVENHSEWQLHHFFVSPTKTDKWGQDWLGKDTISKGEKFKLTGIPCGKYDLKLVDEDGDACVIAGQEFCGDSYTWKITDEVIVSCAAAGDEDE